MLSRRSPSPSPLQRTKSNDSFRSSQSYGNSPCSSRGVSPVQSYLQGQWPKHIRNSLPSRSVMRPFFNWFSIVFLFAGRRESDRDGIRRQLRKLRQAERENVRRFVRPSPEGTAPHRKFARNRNAAARTAYAKSAARTERGRDCHFW